MTPDDGVRRGVHWSQWTDEGHDAGLTVGGKISLEWREKAKGKSEVEQLWIILRTEKSSSSPTCSYENNMYMVVQTD